MICLLKHDLFVGRVDKVSQLWGRVVSFCEPGSDDLTEELVKMMADIGGKVPSWMEMEIKG